MGLGCVFVAKGGKFLSVGSLARTEGGLFCAAAPGQQVFLLPEHSWRLTGTGVGGRGEPGGVRHVVAVVICGLARQ